MGPLVIANDRWLPQTVTTVDMSAVNEYRFSVYTRKVYVQYIGICTLLGVSMTHTDTEAMS